MQNTSLSHVSYNGGAGGIAAQPTAEERLAESDNHLPATQLQTRHQTLASTNRAQFASVNHGTPSLAATPRAAAYKQANVAGAAAGHPQYTGQAHSVATTQNTSHPPGYGQNAPHPQGQPHPQGHPQEHEERR